MSNAYQQQSPPLAPATGSAFLLVKRCPDGGTINLRMESEEALREHIEAMWRYTPGYNLVAVVQLPNNKLFDPAP